MAIKLVTFDLDDTLWDSGRVLRAAEAEMRSWLAEHAPRMSEAFDTVRMREVRARVISEDPDVVHHVSELRRRVLEEAIRASGYGPTEARDLSQQAFAVFLEARQNVELFEGALPMLEVLRASYVLGALTNGNANIERIGLERFFAFHFSSESVGVGKPAPRIFEAALEWAGASPEETVHVGDHPEHDMLGAARVGMYTIWYNSRNFDPLDGVTPTRIAESLQEIPELIASIAEGA